MLLGKVAFLLNVLQLVSPSDDGVTCSKSRAVFDSSGDAVISVFVDMHYGPYCNLTSPKGFQELSTALYVVQTLNLYNYIPQLSLGMRVFDTCHDQIRVYKQALQAAVQLDCGSTYELGILVPATYSPILEPLHGYSVLPISTYNEQNLTKPLISLMVHYLSTRFETIDLILAAYEDALNHFLEYTRDGGICVKGFETFEDLDENNTEAVIALIGERDDIRGWIERGERIEGPRKTYVVLPLDRSHLDDLIPPGSYIIKTETVSFGTIDESTSLEEFLRSTSPAMIHSPYLLDIGKTIVELAQALQDLQRRTCVRDTSCVLPRFNGNMRQEIRNSDVFEALRVLPKSHATRYAVAMKSQQEMIEVAVYRIDAGKLRVTPEQKIPRMPRLCLKKLAAHCETCVNFRRTYDSRDLMTGTYDSKNVLKAGSWVPIFLTMVACGTFACILITIFIVYRFFAEEMLEGNPSLTIVLALGNIFTLQTVLPFCMNDGYFGSEHLNSRKILVSTLAFGLIFSVMVSRAFFLAFSTGGLLTTHVSGYLQALMVLFVYGVQVAMSTMYYLLSSGDSAVVVRSLLYVALLGYDIFLLVLFFAVCCFIAEVQRNYREGKCFFGTAIGLLIAWAVWLTCFILLEPATRDIVVCFGIIATGYLITIGVLIPRTYYMATRMVGNFGQKFNPVDLRHEPRMTTFDRESRPFYDYVHATNVLGSGNLQVPAICPNYYGTSSPNTRHLRHNRDPRTTGRAQGYSNYGYRSEMRELDNSYVVPQVCIENTDLHSSTGRIHGEYARSRGHRRQKVEEKDCIETDVYVEGRLSPSRRGRDEVYPSRCSSPRLGQTEATIREEDESESTRITRF